MFSRTGVRLATPPPFLLKGFMTEKEKFLAWYKDQVENHGMVDIKIDLNPNFAPGTTEEQVYLAMNVMNEAFQAGKYKIFDDTKFCEDQQRANEDFMKEKIYKELNEMNDAVARGDRKPLTGI